MRKTRKCAYCGKEYFVNSGSQKFCSERCAESAKRERKKKVSDFMRAVEPVVEVSRQEYLTFSKAAVLMGCSRQYIYKLVNSGKLAASRLSSRMSLVRRADIEAMLAGNPYHRVLPFANGRRNSSCDAGGGNAGGGNRASSPCPRRQSTCYKKTASSSRQPDEPMEYYSGDEVMSKYKVNLSFG